MHTFDKQRFHLYDILLVANGAAVFIFIYWLDFLNLMTSTLFRGIYTEFVTGGIDVKSKVERGTCIFEEYEVQVAMVLVVKGLLEFHSLTLGQKRSLFKSYLGEGICRFL